MLKLFARYILIGLIVWICRNLLNTILPLPTESMVDGLLDLEKVGDQKVLFFIRFLVWILVFDILIRYTKPFFAFVMPNTRRFSVTKPMRRLQGGLSEFFLLGVFFLTILLILGLISTPAQYRNLKTENWKKYKVSIKNNLVNAKDLLCNKINESANEKNKWLQNSGLTPNSFKNIIYNKKRLDNFVGYKIIEQLENHSFKNCSTLGLINAPLSDNKVKYPNGYIQRNVIEYQATIDVYKAKYFEHNILLERRIEMQKDLLSLGNHFLGQNSDYKNLKAARASYAETWNTLKKNPFILIRLSIKKTWKISLLIALIVYITTLSSSIRMKLAKKYEEILRFFEQSRFGLGGSSRFAGLFEEWNSLYKNQNYGLFLGRSLYNPKLTIGSEDPRHMITIAGSRAGKGTTAIIPNLLLWEGSAVVIDPKGTNAAVTARRRREMGQNVYLIDPFNMVNTNDTDAFDPSIKPRP